MERTKNIKYEGMVNSKKLTDIEKNLRETHQIIFVSSDFKETNKEDDNNDEELRPDSVKLDDDKKISVNNTNNVKWWIYY